MPEDRGRMTEVGRLEVGGWRLEVGGWGLGWRSDVKVRGRTFVGFDRVRRIGRAMVDVEEGLAWGVPALRSGGRVICCTAAHKSAEPNTLVVMIPFDQRDALIEEQPDLYYLKDHYVDFPSILV